MAESTDEDTDEEEVSTLLFLVGGLSLDVTDLTALFYSFKQPGETQEEEGR
jgi:hypothetical protein